MTLIDLGLWREKERLKMSWGKIYVKGQSRRAFGEGGRQRWVKWVGIHQVINLFVKSQSQSQNWTE